MACDILRKLTNFIDLEFLIHVYVKNILNFVFEI